MIAVQLVLAWAVIGGLRSLGRLAISRLFDSHYEVAEALAAIFYGADYQ
jgi:hypothetical protein